MSHDPRLDLNLSDMPRHLKRLDLIRHHYNNIRVSKLALNTEYGSFADALRVTEYSQSALRDLMAANPEPCFSPEEI